VLVPILLSIYLVVKEITKLGDNAINSANDLGEKTTPNNPNNASAPGNTPQVSPNSTVIEPQQKKPQNTNIHRQALEKGYSNFDKTSNVIQKIVDELQNEHQREPEEIQKALKSVLQDNKLNYPGAIKKELRDKELITERKRWVNAISNYQKNQNQKADGIINKDDQTYIDLKEKIITYLNQKSQEKNPPEIK
ncbi:hypothetical protein GNE10_22495, partial [Nostoc sp. 2RC]|nr:hypothetical protein [Nostoc sp. 2RC]